MEAPLATLPEVAECRQQACQFIRSQPPRFQPGDRSSLLRRDERFRSAGRKCLAEFCQHGLHHRRLVLHPAQFLAAPHCLHDRCRNFLYLFSHRLPCLSRSCRREIDPLQCRGHNRRHLFFDADLTRFARIRDSAPCHPHPHSGVFAPLGPAPTNRQMDNANLALRLSYRGPCLLHALQMVSAGHSCTPALDVVC